jgi:hypothetical protein
VSRLGPHMSHMHPSLPLQMSRPGLPKGPLQIQHPEIFFFDEAPDLEHVIYVCNIKLPGAAHELPTCIEMDLSETPSTSVLHLI